MKGHSMEWTGDQWPNQRSQPQLHPDCLLPYIKYCIQSLRAMDDRCHCSRLTGEESKFWVSLLKMTRLESQQPWRLNQVCLTAKSCLAASAWHFSECSSRPCWQGHWWTFTSKSIFPRGKSRANLSLACGILRTQKEGEREERHTRNFPEVKLD